MTVLGAAGAVAMDIGLLTYRHHIMKALGNRLMFHSQSSLDRAQTWLSLALLHKYVKGGQGTLAAGTGLWMPQHQSIAPACCGVQPPLVQHEAASQRE